MKSTDYKTNERSLANRAMDLWMHDHIRLLLISKTFVSIIESLPLAIRIMIIIIIS